MVIYDINSFKLFLFTYLNNKYEMTKLSSKNAISISEASEEYKKDIKSLLDLKVNNIYEDLYGLITLSEIIHLVQTVRTISIPSELDLFVRSDKLFV